MMQLVDESRSSLCWRGHPREVFLVDGSEFLVFSVAVEALDQLPHLSQLSGLEVEGRGDVELVEVQSLAAHCEEDDGPAQQRGSQQAEGVLD